MNLDILSFIRSLIDGSRRAWLIMAAVMAATMIVVMFVGVIGFAVVGALDERGRIERRYAREVSEACAEADRLNGSLPGLGARLRCAAAQVDYACTRLRTIDMELDRRGVAHEPEGKCVGKGE